MISLEQVTKRYPDGTVAVDHLDLEVAEGERCALVGPSGSGKTTTLRMINRLVEPTSGRILLDGEDVTRADPVALRRRIGYVIQQVGLFPHQTISVNVSTVPRLLGWSKTRIAARVEEVLDLVGLPEGQYGHRYPAELSGGQRQRAGVARALAADPPVLLMDEPFGALDPISRDRLQEEFLRLHAEVGKTVILVTHDVDEAIRLGQRIAVLAEGRLVQYATPSDLLARPATPLVAEFVGADRGLKRLSVTPIVPDDLVHPPVVRSDQRLFDARHVVEAAGARWAVVIDEHQHLKGWVAAAELSGEGVVSDRAQRMEAWVPAGASLKIAFAEMLQHDAGWIGVTDGDRYLGVLTPDSLHLALRRSIERVPDAERSALEASA